MKILIILFFFSLTIQCELNGNIEGQCLHKSKIEADIHFCSSYLHEYTCVPFYDDIWSGWTNKTMDELIEKKLTKFIEKEFLSEITLKTISMPLINKVGCLKAYVSFLCQMNFHPCDEETDTSIHLCKSVCETFVNKCGTHKKEICEDFPKENCKKK